jgi:hypothetical protein
MEKQNCTKLVAAAGSLSCACKTYNLKQQSEKKEEKEAASKQPVSSSSLKLPISGMLSHRMTVSRGPPICPCFTLTKARTPPPDANSSIESWLPPTLPPGTSEKYRSWPASSEAEPNPGGTVWTPSKSTRRAGKMSRPASSAPWSRSTPPRLFAPTSKIWCKDLEK